MCGYFDEKLYNTRTPTSSREPFLPFWQHLFVPTSENNTNVGATE
jgi:hypothetical protein